MNDQKVPVPGVDDEEQATDTRERGPAGFLSVFHWAEGNLQFSFNVDHDAMTKAFDGKKPVKTRNGEKTYADITAILSKNNRGEVKSKSTGKVIKTDVTGLFMALANAFRDDKEGALKPAEVESVLTWTLNKLKVGENPRTELTELKALKKHLEAGASVTVPVHTGDAKAAS